jgi:hypothetical protein
MSTPLYKFFKSKGTSFFAFPSTSSNPNPNFSKFVLLDIPARSSGTILDFSTTYLTGGEPFNIYTENIGITSKYSDQMVESLRNYVANQDTTFRESKLNQTNDFYNIKEPQTPTEKIFWKWMKKFGAIDFETAENKVDWNKNLPDFDNPNSSTISNTDYFRKYLWKEREITSYDISDVWYESTPQNTLVIYSDFLAKYKVGDKITLTGDFDTVPTGNTNVYEIFKVDEGATDTTIYITVPDLMGIPTYTSGTTTLSYHKLVQYIGEINVTSQVHTATKDETEVTAYIPHQAGATPTIMWEIKSDTNYYPSLELPLLSSQIQTEIRGAENLTSPIRQDPGDYPGSYYGQFDDTNKTYTTSSGDKIRYRGDYYGILRNDNVGLDADNYVERLGDFNSDYIDGLTLDFNLNHYLKMDIKDSSVGFNFDEFNQISIDGEAPKDFSYNAILWYYEVPLDNGGVVNNLYGVTFLNNPDNDDNGTTNDAHITTYEKLVQTEEHDGLSYVHTLNLSTSVDNDTSSLSFDPLTLNNTFGFDLYNNLMSNVGKLNESFINIINEFVRMNTELNDVKSIIYSQTDIDFIKSKLKNMEELLKLYATYQFVETETVKINEDYSGVYPTLSFDVKGVEYESVVSTTTSNIKNYMDATQSDYSIEIPETNRLFLRITNNDIVNTGSLSLIFNKDLQFKQSAIIYIDVKDAVYTNKLSIYMNYDNGSVIGPQRTLFIDNIYLPIDIASNISNNVVYATSKWLSSAVFQNVSLVTFTGTTGDPNTARTVLYMTDANIFGDVVNEQTVYIHDFKFVLGSIVYDFSGMYTVESTEYNQAYIKIKLDTSGYTPIGIPRVYIYKGIKLEILRVDESNTSSINDRYLIQKTFI